MKHYMFVFLMFWSTTLFAPQYSKLESKLIELNQISNVVSTEENAEEIMHDSIDIKTLTHYKMKQFTKEDRKKVREIAKRLRIKPKWLYKIFYIECRGDVKATNPYTKATGLIGFLPSTAIKLGTTTEQLQKMSISEQLYYVEKYFNEVLQNRRMRSSSDVYMAIFSPANIGQADSTLIGRKCKLHQSKVYKYNKTLDMNKDSVITVEDIKLFIALL